MSDHELLNGVIVYPRAHFGTVEIVNTYRPENDALVLGSYAIHRDQNGNETRRTEPSDTCRIMFA